MNKGTIKKWIREAFKCGLECEGEPYTAIPMLRLEARIDRYFERKEKI